MHGYLLAIIPALLLASPMAMGSATLISDSQYIYRQVDSRLGNLGDGVGDIVTVPHEIEMDRQGRTLVLLKVRVLPTREEELSARGYSNESGRMPGPYRYELMAVSAEGEVKTIIEGESGSFGDANPLNGVASGEDGIYLFSRGADMGPDGIFKVRYYSGKNRKLSFTSDSGKSANVSREFGKHARAILKIIEKKGSTPFPVKIITSPLVAVMGKGVPGWREDTMILERPINGYTGTYSGGVCVGIDDQSRLYLLMTRQGPEDDFAVRQPQDLIVMTKEGHGAAVIELPPWREDLWSSNGENIRILGDGSIVQLWGQGRQVSLRRWVRQGE